MSYGVSLLWAQESIISQVEYIKSPTEKIIFIDSILYFRPDIGKDTILALKKLQAQAYQDNNNNVTALNIYKEILPSFAPDTDEYAKILLLIAHSNVHLDRTPEATKLALQALDLATKYNEKSLMASANNVLSYIYYKTNDYDKALDYLKKSIVIQRQIKDSANLSASYNNIAIIYKQLGDLNKALAYNKQSYQISERLQDYIGMGKSYSNIGRIYELLDQKDKALQYYKKAINNNEKYNIKNSIPYKNTGDVYLIKQSFDSAHIYFLKALQIDKLNKNTKGIADIYKSLSEIAYKNKQFPKSFAYQKKSDSVRHELLKIQHKEKLMAINHQYQLYNSQKDLEHLQSINKKNKIIFLILISFLLAIALIWYQKNKNKQLLAEKDKLYLEQKVLRSQMNPHFIFNALSAIQNTLMDNDPIKSAGYLSRFAKLIRQNFDFLHEKQILLKDEIDALKNYLDVQKLRFDDKFDYEINIFADVDLESIEIPPLLLQPFIENAINHGFQGITKQGFIKINIFRKDKQICFEITDNGKGFDVKQAKDNRMHAIDIFKQRLHLLEKEDEKTFRITSSEKGTQVFFCLHLF